MLSNNQLSVLTFNIWNVWRMTKKAWNRDDLAAEVLLEADADIVCLQEFDGPFRHEEVNLPDLISGVYDEAVPAAVAPEDNWNPIFYRRSRFEPVATGHRVYSTGTEYPYRETGRSHFRTLTWAILREKDSGELRTVVNTHYDTDQNNLQSESDELMETVRQLQEHYPSPVLVTGDYNCRIRGIAIQNMFANGYVDTYDLATDKHAKAGCHPYPILNEKTLLYDTYDDHFYAETYSEAIDHVFLLGKAEVRSYQTIINDKTLYISDHSPVIVNLCFDSTSHEKKENP